MQSQNGLGADKEVPKTFQMILEYFCTLLGVCRGGGWSRMIGGMALTHKVQGLCGQRNMAVTNLFCSGIHKYVVY